MEIEKDYKWYVNRVNRARTDDERPTVVEQSLRARRGVSLMYSLRQLRRGLEWTRESPKEPARELNRLYYRYRNGPEYSRTDIDVFEEDWDTLIILDTLVRPFPGPPQPRR